MWVEAGYAIEEGKQCTFLVPQRDCLPPALREGSLPDNVRIVEYGDQANFLDKLNKAPAEWLTA